jgi:hypothetical protein
MDSKRISTLILGVVAVFVMGSVVGAQRSAADGDPIFDDFSDMDVTDDTPVSWHWNLGVVLDAASGDLVLTCGLPPLAAARPNGQTSPDISVRTQVRLLEGEFGGGPEHIVGVWARFRGWTGYGAGIAPDGGIRIIRGAEPGFMDDILLAGMMTDLDVFNSDIHLRFDLFGDTLSLTAWADGTPEPDMPQLTVMDTTVFWDGLVGVVGQRGFSGSRTVFRFFETRLPPEPEIDIKPWSDVNPVNPFSQGVIPVAILGSDVFDVADVDPTTLAFGPNEAAPKHAAGGHVKDVNDDGLMDLLSHYRTQDTGIAIGDTEACVTGETFDRMPFEGCDGIKTVGGCGLGFELFFLLPPLLWLRQRRRSRSA